jgi:PAS domain S-box-containing protein
MTTKPSKPKIKTTKKKKISPLRKRADKMPAKQKERPRDLSAKDLKKLVQDLETHQIELEMQNEELRRTRHELETSRNKFAELYDFSPVGYFTIDARGLIREVNLTGAELLGVTKRLLLNKPFSLFIARGDSSVYHIHRDEVFRLQTRQICELRMNPRNAPEFYARLQSTAVENADDQAGQIRTAVIDITKRKRAEEERERLIGELQTALSKIKTLTGLLPICASCKKIRDDSGYWQQVEQYISDHTDAMFTHGICPECYKNEIESIEKLKKR